MDHILYEKFIRKLITKYYKEHLKIPNLQSYVFESERGTIKPATNLSSLQ